CRLQLAYLVRRHAIDIVHASNVGRGEAAVYLQERTGTPFVLSIHGVLSPRERKYRCLSRAPRLIAFDVGVLHRLERLQFVPPEARAVNRRHGRELIHVTGPLLDPWPVLRGAALVIGGGYAALEGLMHGKMVLGAGFRGFGVVTAENVRQADGSNFGDSAGEWKPTPEALLAALQELHAGFSDLSQREHYCHLDRIVGAEHSTECIAGRLDRIYQAVLAEAGKR